MADAVHIRAGARPGMDRRMRWAPKRGRVEHGAAARTLCGAEPARGDLGADIAARWLAVRGTPGAPAWLADVCPTCAARLAEGAHG